MLFYVIFAVLVGHITCQSRIVGGGYANPGDFPYQVSLQLNGYRICGGSIISENFILTAAHCTFPFIASEMKVIVGATNLSAVDVMSFDVAEFINHPQYAPPSYDYDISLIRLSNPLPLGTYTVDKIEMVAPDAIVTPNAWAVVSGFGYISFKSETTDYLKYAYVELWGPDTCNTEYSSKITDRMFCAGNPGGEDNACRGDSGGPLAVDNKLLGVVSWGFPCGADHPAIYTNVAVFRKWIREQSGV